MTHIIRMILKHLCLSGMVGIIQSKRIYFATLAMFYVANFSHFTSILARDLFPKLLEKALQIYDHR